MLDHLGGVTTFRCGGCGRALKVPAQFRNGTAPAPAPSRPPARDPDPHPHDATRAMPRVPTGPVATRPVAAAPLTPVTPVAPVPGGLANPGVPTARTPAVDRGIDGPPPDARTTDDAAPIDPESLKPPLILRLVLWVIALPLGSLLTFAFASALGVLTKSQLEDTFLRADWGRFVPIARLLPFCALATALLVQLGVFLLEQLHARNLRARRAGGPKRGPGGGGRPRPTRPHTPRGPAQRAGNGGTRRDRVTS
jgi:hypothetical protein